MEPDPIITASELSDHLDDPGWLVVDCRFALANPDEKEIQYLEAHIPGAIYVHLDRDLSAEIIPGKTGRHPLPAPEQAARRLGELGITSKMQVVAYDDQGGALAAGRLWLILRWLGHDRAAVLDGGWQKWLQEARPTVSGRESRPPGTFEINLREGLFAGIDEVERIRQDPDYRLVDIRLPERYRGEVEPLDRIAGHIPGAINIPYLSNLAEDWTFLPPEVLRKRYSAILGDVNISQVVLYCGSGVTSILSLLALLHAGLGQARIYPGSWSEWIADGHHHIAVGPES